MKKIEKEAQHLHEEVLEMWTLVDQQIRHAIEALLKNDKGQAYSVVCRERKVNAYELKIDSDCEDIIALYAPVAIDLRYVLSIFKINTNLERLGDAAEDIAELSLRRGNEVIPELLALLVKTGIDVSLTCLARCRVCITLGYVSR